MDIRIAAQETRKKLAKCHSDPLPGGDAVSVEYVAAMLTSIESGSVVGEKANRWLGWAQAVICCRGGATLEELKLVNYQA